MARRTDYNRTESRETLELSLLRGPTQQRCRCCDIGSDEVDNDPKAKLS